jgi:hypothetical protein
MPSTIAAAARTRPSADAPVPNDVTDVMLWRLAFDVAVEHRRGPDGNCTTWRCVDQRGPCDAAIGAQQALHAARRTPTTPPQTASLRATQRTVPPPVTATTHHHDRVVGRAAVTTPPTARFTGWFTQTATAAASGSREHLPRRIPGAASAAA